MQQASKKGFRISCIAHGAAFVLLFVFTIIPKCTKEEEPFVFEMVNAVASNEAISNPRVSTVKPTPKPVSRPKPKITPKPPVVKPTVKPKPKPKPPVVKPKPVKVIPKPKPIPKPVKVTPKPKTESTLSAKDFFKDNPRKPQPKVDTRPEIVKAVEKQAKPFVAPRIDTGSNNISEIQRELKKEMERQSASASSEAIERYKNRLRQKIESLWSFEVSVIKQVTVIVQFHISRDGRISNVRIVKSSGNSEIDRTALKAFSDLGRFSAPPNGSADFRIPFVVDP